MLQPDNLSHPNEGQTDDLSAFTHHLLKLGGSEAYSRLVVEGPGNEDAKAALEMANSAGLLSVPVRQSDDAQAMLAGLWLWYDWLDESHRISQGLASPTGSFWHAIMHRRQGDFSNSRYWYARCQSHPILAALGVQAAQLLNPLPADKSLLRLISGGWSTDAFVELVRSIHEAAPANAPEANEPRRVAVVALQKLEWRLLFEFCTRSAAGK